MNFIDLTKKVFGQKEIKANDPYRDQAIEEIEKITKMKHSQIVWIRKNGSCFYAADIDPILLLDLIKFGEWSAS